MFEIQPVLIALVTLLVFNYIYRSYIDYTKDVSELFLTDQSVVDATRLPEESAVYKSNKLDYSLGLRVGLGIRYDHYKLRNGNLCDIWEVLMNYCKKVDKEKSIVVKGPKAGNGKPTIRDDSVKPHSETFLSLNHRIHVFGDMLKEKNISHIKINLQLYITSIEILVIMIAAFTNQVNVEFYDKYENLAVIVDQTTLFVIDGDTNDNQIDVSSETKHSNIYNISTLPPPDNQIQPDFENDYSSIKDKGIALTITRKLNNKILATVEFTQLNIISSLASTLKHLPASQALNDTDTLLIVQNHTPTNDQILNDLVKMLAGFISHSNIIVAHDIKTWKDVYSYQPTVLSISQEALAQFPSTESYISKMNGLKKFIFNQRMVNLAKGKFSSSKVDVGRSSSQNLRLVYISKQIQETMKFSLLQLNQLRCLHSCRVIVELTYYNIIGPIVLTDFYDYRLLDIANLRSYGCLSQAVECKLVKLDSRNRGQLYVRGYNIAKTSTKLMVNGKGIAQDDDNKSVMKQNNGFMPLTNVFGIWGNDGCLYVV